MKLSNIMVLMREFPFLEDRMILMCGGKKHEGKFTLSDVGSDAWSVCPLPPNGLKKEEEAQWIQDHKLTSDEAVVKYAQDCGSEYEVPNRNSVAEFCATIAEEPISVSGIRSILRLLPGAVVALRNNFKVLDNIKLGEADNE